MNPNKPLAKEKQTVAATPVLARSLMSPFVRGYSFIGRTPGMRRNPLPPVALLRPRAGFGVSKTVPVPEPPVTGGVAVVAGAVVPVATGSPATRVCSGGMSDIGPFPSGSCICFCGGFSLLKVLLNAPEHRLQ